MLFRLEEGFDLTLLEVDGELVLGIDHGARRAPKLDAALKKWKEMRDLVDFGAISAEEFEEWKLNIKPR